MGENNRYETEQARIDIENQQKASAAAGVKWTPGVTLPYGGNQTTALTNAPQTAVQQPTPVVEPPYSPLPDVGPIGTFRYPFDIGGVPRSETTSRGKSPFVVFQLHTRKSISALEPMAFAVEDSNPPRSFRVILPQPSSSLKTVYGIDYEQVDLGEWALASGEATQLWGAVNKLVTPDGLVQAFKGALDVAGAVAQIAKIPAEDSDRGAAVRTNIAFGTLGLLPRGEGLQAMLKKSQGFQLNPFTEVLFKNVKFRVHEFEYIFLPKSYQDSLKIDEIIRAFRYYMHPKHSGSSQMKMAYPAEFSISYSNQNTTFGILPSVLENMDVDYSGGLDTPRFFVPENKDGLNTSLQFPARITMKLTFREVAIITRNSLQKDENMVSYQ